MTKLPTTNMRQLPAKNHWKDTEEPEHKAEREKAWQEYRCCRDCKHWASEDDKDVGACMLPEWNANCASFICPEDYTCMDFEAGKFERD
jgi:hypothetical protein